MSPNPYGTPDIVADVDVLGTPDEVVDSDDPTSYVASFNGRTGSVTPQPGDYTANQIGGMTTGSIIFADSSGRLGQDNANLFYDDTNNRLGVGTNAPSETLTVTGSLRVNVFTGEDVAFVGDAGTQVLKIHDTRTALGQAAIYVKNDGGGGSIQFQRTIVGVGTAKGQVGLTGAWTGSATNQDDMALGAVDNMRFFVNNSVTPTIVVSTADQVQFPKALTAAAGLLIGGDTVLYRGSADLLQTDDGFKAIRAATTSASFMAAVNAEAVNRLVIRADGRMDWSDGTAAADVVLSRTAAGVLNVGTGNLTLAGKLSVGNSTLQTTTEFLSVTSGVSFTGQSSVRTVGVRTPTRTTDVITTAHTGDLSVWSVEQATITSTPAGTVIPDLAGIRIKGPVTSGGNATATRTTAVLVETGADANIGLAVRQNSATQSARLVAFTNAAGSVLAGIAADGQFRAPDGNVGTSGISFNNDTDNGFYRIGTDNFAASAGGSKILDLKNNAGTLQMGFFGTAAVNRPTGVAVDATSIHAALVTLGLITA